MPSTQLQNILCRLEDTHEVSEIGDITRLLGVYREERTDEVTAFIERLERLVWDEGVRCSAKMTALAVNWLRGQHQTPRGRVRETSPFGYRESDVILRDDVTIEWTGMTDRNHDNRTYVPQFKVYSAAEDDGFLYLLNQGKPDIIG